MPDDKPPAVLLQHPRAPVQFEPYRCTPESLARAKSEAAKERAEVDAACKAYDLSYAELTTRESLQQHTIAEEAASVLHCTPLDELPRERRYELECGAAYLMRRPESAWRAAAMAKAAPVVAALLREELVLHPAVATVLAVKCVSYATAAYQAVLEGTEPISPGQYMRIEDAKRATRG